MPGRSVSVVGFGDGSGGPVELADGDGLAGEVGLGLVPVLGEGPVVGAVVGSVVVVGSVLVSAEGDGLGSVVVLGWVEGAVVEVGPLGDAGALVAGVVPAVVGGAAEPPFDDVNRTAANAPPPSTTRTTTTVTTIAQGERDVP